jgi:hypothetical protein
MNTTDLTVMRKEHIMATLAHEDDPSVNGAFPRAHLSVVPRAYSEAQHRQIWQTVKIAAGYAAATAVLIVAWFALLSLVYQSFARIVS